jgi:hypothetical protein
MARLWLGFFGLGERVFVTLGLGAVFAALGGIYWDVTWHATLGRESFWIAPHLFVYSGVNVLLLSGFGGLALVWWRVGGLRSTLTDRVGVGFVVATLGPVIQISAAPFDDLWHRLYGLDVTIWSPPHLMGIVGGMVGIYGLLAVLKAELPGREPRPLWRGTTASEATGMLLFGAALSLSMFALGELDFHLQGRDALFYPMLAGALAAVPLMAAAQYVGRFGAATAVALTYTIFRLLVLLLVWGMGSTEHLTPPVFVLVPALAIDLALYLTKQRGVLVAALLSGPALLLGEWLSRTVFGGPSWEALEVAPSLATVTAAVAVGALAGDRLQSSMVPRRAGDLKVGEETPR